MIDSEKRIPSSVIKPSEDIFKQEIFFRIGRKRDNKNSILLDTNIWRYIIDNKAQGALIMALRDSSHQILVAPAVMYETLRLKDSPLRAKIIRLTTNTRFVRLMPEAYSESMEILREITRCRPDWLRPLPDLAFFNRLEQDWSRRTGGFWVRCARSSDREAQILNQIEGDTIEAAQVQARLARKEMMNSGWKHNPSMNKTLMAFTHPVPGWRGDMVEAWRMDSLVGLTYALSRRGNAYRDWIAPFVEVDEGLLGSAAWVEFWLYLANKSALPRQWMRWAHSFAQRFRKVTAGSPGDTQLTTYVLEADIVITADKALTEILEECRPYAPCSLPAVQLVPAGHMGVTSLLRVLET